jgi:hypothetical protein
MPWVAPSVPLCLAARLSLILEGLCRTIAERGLKLGADAALIGFAWLRLRRLSARFTNLVEAIRAGKPPKERRRSAASSAASGARSGRAHAAAAPDRMPPLPRLPRLPNGFGWLLQLVPDFDVRNHASQVQHWLNDPEVAAVIAAHPRRAGRILRPLLRMLGIPIPPELALPPRDRKAPAEAPASGCPATSEAPSPAGSGPRAGSPGSSPGAGSSGSGPSREPPRPAGLGFVPDDAGADPPLALKPT